MPVLSPLTEIEIQDVSLPPKQSDQLWGCSLQVPLVGSGDVGFWIHIGGYVSGRWRPAAAVEFVEGDQVVKVAAVRISRPDVALSRPGEREVEVCGFYTLVDARKLSPEFDLRVEAVLENGMRVPMGSVRGRHRYHLTENGKPPPGAPAPPAPAPANQKGSEPSVPSVPSIRDDLKGLVLEALGDDGNRLLADGEAWLDEVESSLLDGLVLAGKTVLDVGAGMGERARAARARGASLVDGFEPDPQLVALARLLNAYRHTGRVSFHQRDDVLRDPGGQEYDVVMALNAFDLVCDRLEAIATVTRGVLVTELPATDPDRSTALQSVRACFPFHELLELSGGPGAPSQQPSRLFLVGATDAQKLQSAQLG